MTLEAGLIDPSMLETQVKKAMIASAQQVIVLLDSSKFGLQSLTLVISSAETDLLITGSGAPEGMVQSLREQGGEAHLAKKGD